MAVVTDIIQVKNVSKTYRQGHEVVAALRDVSLAVRAGELLAIVGSSGSGKTTLTHIIGGLLSPTKGMVLVDGRELSRRNDKVLSRYRNTRVGFVFQNFSLLPYYTAAENVTIPLILAGIAPAKRRQRAVQCLQLVGLEHRVDQCASDLSGGERQRVSIARALVNKPQVIIADEPTGSLDSARGREIMAILQTLSHQHGMAVVMVTHDQLLAAEADRMVHIRDGQIQQEVRRANR